MIEGVARVIDGLVGLDSKERIEMSLLFLNLRASRVCGGKTNPSPCDSLKKIRARVFHKTAMKFPPVEIAC